MNEIEALIDGLSRLYRAEYRSLAASFRLRRIAHESRMDLHLLQRHFADTTEHIIRLSHLLCYLGYPLHAEVDSLGGLVIKTPGKKEVFPIVSVLSAHDDAAAFLSLQHSLLKDYRLCLDLAQGLDRPKVKLMLALSLAERLESEQRLAKGLRVDIDLSQAARGFDLGTHLQSTSTGALPPVSERLGSRPSS